MSGVRLLVGTRKGAFVLTADGTRREWRVSGPHFAGWEMYHLKGSPADPNRLYASQSSGWFGQLIQRSDDGGATWTPVSNVFAYDGVPGTHQWYDGTPHPWEFKRVWHLEPSLTDPDIVYAGVEDAALFKTADGGHSWQELPGLRGPRLRTALAARRRRVVPAHGHPRSVRRSAHLRRDLRRRGVPQRRRRSHVEGDQSRPEIGRHSGSGCRGRALRPSHRDASVTTQRALHAEALGRDAQSRRRRFVARSQRRPADRLRLCDRRARPRAGNDLRRADHQRLAALSTRRPPARLSQPHRRRRVGTAGAGLPQENCYVNVLRDAMSVDTLDRCGIYFGTTGGQVYASTDAGDTWTAIVPRSAPGAVDRGADARLRRERRLRSGVGTRDLGSGSDVKPGPTSAHSQVGPPSGMGIVLVGPTFRSGVAAAEHHQSTMIIRIELPAHLRNLAGVRREVALDVEADGAEQVSLAAALDALEARYPPCAARSAITARCGGGRSSGSSPANRISRTPPRPIRCRHQSPAATSRCSWSGRWPAGRTDQSSILIRMFL